MNSITFGEFLLKVYLPVGEYRLPIHLPVGGIFLIFQFIHLPVGWWVFNANSFT